MPARGHREIAALFVPETRTGRRLIGRAAYRATSGLPADPRFAQLLDHYGIVDFRDKFARPERCAREGTGVRCWQKSRIRREEWIRVGFRYAGVLPVATSLFSQAWNMSTLHNTSE